MPSITLPDGSVLEFDQPVTAGDVAAKIGPGLAKAALGARIDGELRDLGTVIDRDVEVTLVTAKRRDGSVDPDALHLVRHSCAHVMAEAIQRVVPGVLLVYGPPVENGFYYDLTVPADRPLSTEDFEAIEREMAAIVAEDRPFTRYELSVDDGRAKLEGEGSKYKLDNAERAVQAGSRTLSWYATGTPGDDWEDLCRGPHVPSTGRIGAFKIMSLASSYWHGDENSDRLTRVWGTAFPDRKQLDEYLHMLEEAKKRDHRVLGKKHHLFHIDEMVGQGLVLWTPKGATIRQELQTFISHELARQGYHQVFTPHIGKLDLYRTSGHFPYYQDSQYPPIIMRDEMQMLAEQGCTCADLANAMSTGTVDGYLLKPMNCPHHVKIYAAEQRSYRDLPLRLAEFGTVYRWEKSGEIGGMLRVRCFTQDDAHIFCTEDQVGEELIGCLELVKIIFSTLGMEDFRVRVGLRDPGSGKYVGEPALWERAETACREAAETLGVPYTEERGEAAFYGPKIDFIVKDVLGREWQLGTVQVDYNLPERFDLSYIGPDNQPHRPVMIHRAPFGSFERFVGFLIEHFGASFPTWLAPEQARVLPISDKSLDYGRTVLESLRGAAVRVTLETSNDKIGAKIKVATDERIPYLLVVGQDEVENQTVSVRVRGTRKNLGDVPVAAFVDAISQEIASRGKSTVQSDLFAGAASTPRA